jgi:hypothetical protein
MKSFENYGDGSNNCPGELKKAVRSPYCREEENPI